MLMIPARLGRSESFWAVVKVRSPHTGPEVCYIIKYPVLLPIWLNLAANQPLDSAQIPKN